MHMQEGRKVLDSWRLVCGQQKEGQGEKNQKPAKADNLMEQVQ